MKKSNNTKTCVKAKKQASYDIDDKIDKRKVDMFNDLLLKPIEKNEDTNIMKSTKNTTDVKRRNIKTKPVENSTNTTDVKPVKNNTVTNDVMMQ